MSESKNRVQDFAAAGREHLNAGERARAALFAAFAFSVVALALELSFLLRGHRVAPLILFVPLVVATLVAWGVYARFRYSHLRAVGRLDHFFNIKEGLITADEHIRAGRNEEIHALQIDHTARKLEGHDPASARRQTRRRLWGLAGVLIVLVGGLLFIDDSTEVKTVRAEAETTMALSTEVAEDLKEEYERMIEEADPEIKEMLEDPALKSAVEQFEGGGDRRAVMRALSEIDRELAKMSGQFDTRADESYLKELAEYLSEGRETAAIGEALSNSDYKQAASALESMRLNDPSSAAEREALEKLAARIGEAEKSMSNNESGSRRSANEMSREIKKMANEAGEQGKASNESKASVNDAMNKSGDGMRQVQAKSNAQSALDRLRESLAQGQNRMNGEGPGQGGEGQQPGGDGWGEGVDRSRRGPDAESPSDGELEHLSGLLGEGESEKVIEDAFSGAGVATAAGGDNGAVARERQMEAFVRRDDVPEEMKHGVKTYFERIHELEKRINEGASDGKE
ncbi:hypothetical protein P4C99_12540 [Pontiellaceae bacterium B1224]|nr:hypothetical protein [Pontiellaceae bacterium B1224]